MAWIGQSPENETESSRSVNYAEFVSRVSVLS
jgi:hypothetical protein